jgi:P27 family predicted phage terminase small subunit
MFFSCYCEAVASFRRANAKLLEQGELVLDADGLPMRNPWAKVRADAAAEIHRFGSEFGLSPSIRARFLLREVDKPIAAAGVAAAYFTR